MMVARRISTVSILAMLVGLFMIMLMHFVHGYNTNTNTNSNANTNTDHNDEENMIISSLKMLHRFSPEFRSVKEMMKKSHFDEMMGTGHPDYYKFLHHNDIRRQMISTNPSSSSSDKIFSFASGNGTMDFGELLGWLHYAVMDIGTPNTSFLVALDTGSDLFWVPCECKQCASMYTSSQQLDMALHVYDPGASNTSRHVSCLSHMCSSSGSCEDGNEDCLYSVRYVSGNTSTSGMLVEDVIHLTSQNPHGSSHIEARVVFGCGQVQSGNFLDGGAPDGLLGLGFGPIALPNSLARSNFVRNSFSMCFQPDGSGTIFFGDKGLSTQQTTPFLPSNGTFVRYVVGLDQILVGSRTLHQEGVNIIIDTGTSFTYLPKEVYLAVTMEFDAHIREKRASFYDVPWEFCYKANSNDVQTPPISLVFKGGGNFSVFSPLIAIDSGNGTMDGFCLAIIQSDIAILGQSFMTGYQFVFDREDMKLGWTPSDCYGTTQEDIGVGATSRNGSFPLTNIPSINSPSPSPSDGEPNGERSSSNRVGSQTTCFYRICHLVVIFLVNTLLVQSFIC